MVRIQSVRSTCSTILLAGLMVVALSAGAQNKPAADWPIFRGNALQTGVANSALPEQLAVRWTFQAKESIEGTAAIVADTVFIGSMDEHLYALDLASGKPKWSYKAGPFKAPPSVRAGQLYVGDLDGMFHCLDAASGRKLWTFDMNAEISAGATFAGENILIGSGDETLYCLSSEGKPRWKFKVPGGPVLGSPAVVANRTFAAGCDSTLHVIDLDTGKELASVELGGQVGASAAVMGDQLYVGTMTNQFLAVDWKKAAVVWTYEAAQRPQPFYSSAAVTDALVVVGSRDRLVHALDPKTGNEVWNFATRDKVDSSPVIVGGRVYVGSGDGNLYALDLGKGRLIQKLELGSAILGSPAVGPSCLIVGTRKGVVYCLGMKE